jgi:hypothetical protein
MTNEADVYRRLQEALDELPIRYPRTTTGVEIRILRRLFTPAEAEVALALGGLPEAVGKIQRRLPGRTVEELARLLDAMLARGVIFGHDSPGAPRRYSMAPLVIGMYEGQVDRLTKELQQDFEQYAREGFAGALLAGKTRQMRTIPVNARFVPDRRVGQYDDARRLIGEGPGPWATRNCVCRQGQDLLGEPCRQTTSRRVCLMIGGAARLLLRDAAGGSAVPEARGVPPVQLLRRRGPGAVHGVRDLPLPLPHGRPAVGGRRDRGRPRPLHRLRPVREHLPHGGPPAAGEGAGDRPSPGPQGPLRADRARALRRAGHAEEDRPGDARPADLTPRGRPAWRRAPIPP